MSQIASQIEVVVNGHATDTFDDFTFDPGGEENTPAPTRLHPEAYTVKTTPSQLDINVPLDRDFSLKTLDVRDAVIQINFDTGQRYMMRGCSRGPTPKAGNDGKLKYTFFGKPAEEVVA